MLWRFTVFLAFLAIGFCNSTNVLAAKRVALVIGNSNYVNATRLTNPANDATDVAHALDNLGFKVVQGLDLELASMQRAVQDFAERLKGAEVGLLFYSGHGLQVAGINYLVPTNASVRSEADLDFQLLRLDLILKQMEREAKTNIVILDACRNNPLSRNLARNMGTRSTRVGDGLAQIQVGTGTFIAYATQPGNVALDGMAGSRNSPFTAALLQNIPRPRDEIAQLMRKVRRNVMEVTGGEQVPWDSSSLVEDFYFASVSSQQPKPSDISLQSTASIKQEAIKQGEKVIPPEANGF